MKHIKTIGVCLAAMFVIAAIASASASAAEPALYECTKTEKVDGKYTGKYINSTCSEEATAEEVEKGKTNKFEIEEGIRKGKTFKGKGKGWVLGVGAGSIECGDSAVTGKPTSPTTLGHVVITFEGCTSGGYLLGHGCESVGQEEGTVVTDALAGTFGYLAGKGGKTPQVGLELHAENGEEVARFDCGEIHFAFTGSAIGEIMPVNEFSKESDWRFRGSGDKQQWTKFEEQPENILQAYYCLAPCEPLTEGYYTSPAMLEAASDVRGEDLMLKA